MQAIRPLAPGGAEVLELRELPTPTPGPGQVLVHSEAAGVNFIDVYQRSGQYKTARPIPLGLEGAGRVEALGEGVTGVSVGQRIAWVNVPGSYSTHVLVPAERALTLPDGVSSVAAAAVLLQGLTAHYLAYDTFALKAGHTALVHAAAGGVGLLLVQLAKLRGARVIGTVSTEEKAQIARQAGADEVVLYTQQDFQQAAREFTAGRGVDVVYDSVGAETFEGSLRSLAPRGTLALYGQSSGAVPPLDPQQLAAHGSLYLTRPTLGHYTLTRAELVARANDLFALVARGALNVRIDRQVALAETRSAHEALEARSTIGKIVLLPG